MVGRLDAARVLEEARETLRRSADLLAQPPRRSTFGEPDALQAWAAGMRASAEPAPKPEPEPALPQPAAERELITALADRVGALERDFVEVVQSLTHALNKFDSALARLERAQKDESGDTGGGAGLPSVLSDRLN
jgi:hypothetical protein